MNRLLVLSIFLWVVPVRADIMEWRDADGVRHYTNRREEIPAAHRQEAEVVIDEQWRRNAPAPPAELESAAPGIDTVRSADAGRQAEVLEDRRALADAYQAGMDRGLEIAAPLQRQAPAELVQINGPLAVATLPQAPEPYVGPYTTPYFISPFDGGRSRHVTLRMLMQDQYILDSGPYVVAAPPLRYLPTYLPRDLGGRETCRRPFAH